jgi:hypothetical protein
LYDPVKRMRIDKNIEDHEPLPLLLCMEEKDLKRSYLSCISDNEIHYKLYNLLCTHSIHNSILVYLDLLRLFIKLHTINQEINSLRNEGTRPYGKKGLF